MTYESIEESDYSAMPTRLYLIKLGTTNYYLTSAESDVVVGSITYKSTLVDDTGFVESGEQAKNELSLKIPHDHAVSEYLIQYIPSIEITISISQLHRTDSPIEVVNQWAGVLTSWEMKYPEMNLIFSPNDYEINREMMPRTFGPDCQWTQFDNGCGLLPSSFSANLIVSTVSIFNITFSSTLPNPSPIPSPNIHYQGGYIEVLGDHGYERARIVSHGSTSVVVDRVLPGLVIGATVTIVPSCRGDINRCDVYFNNRVKFFGAPHADKINPFTGDGVKKSGDIYS